MKQAVAGLMLAASLGCAQAPTPGSQTGEAGSTGAGSGQTMTGVLMDAACSVIASTRGTSGVTRSRTGSEPARDAGATSGGESASAQGTTGTATTATPGSSSPGATQNATVGEPSRGAMRDTGATSGANSASALGTTGAATTSGPVNTGMTEVERNRMVMTVREKYRDCMAKAATTEFALHANGQLYLLDRESSEMVRQQMRNEAFRASMSDSAGSPQWITVTVTGKPSGDTLAVRSVRR